jgi:hypothetical protein
MLKELELEFEEDFLMEDNGLHEEEPSDPEVPEDFYEKFPKLAVCLSQHYVKLFFKGLPLYCGGPVPAAYLSDPKLIRLILNTAQIDAVDKAHRIMQGRLREYEIKKNSHVTNHISIILDVIQRCVRLRIPSCYRGGIILAALKYLLGFSVNV